MRSVNKALARFALACLVVIPASAAVAASAPWPTKPIRLIVPAHSTPEEFRKRIARDVARWKEVVKRGKIKIDVIG
jgi:tripartite-type tricarboxylate transporter receptor subunit TctC